MSKWNILLHEYFSKRHIDKNHKGATLTALA